MTDEEYRERILAIESEANAELVAARKRFHFWHEPRRASRYRDGMADAIIESAIAPIRDEIERQMRAKTEAVERAYYEEAAACGQ